MLQIGEDVLAEMVGHMLGVYPLEGCGLLVGAHDERGATVARFVACRNVAASSLIYTLDPGEHLRAERAAEDDALEVIGVAHSHTHSEAYPSPTDIFQAPDPGWHYMIVSLKRAAPSTRSYTIAEGRATEEPVEVTRGGTAR